MSFLEKLHSKNPDLPVNDWARYEPDLLKNDPRKRINTNELELLESYHKDDRQAKCGGIDPIEIVVAYAQNHLIYDTDNRLVATTKDCTRIAIDDMVNKFGKAYRDDAPILLHKTLAEIVVDAAILIYNENRFRLRIYDGLRSMEAGWLMYENATPQGIELLAKPGNSAHNRALAVDCSLLDEQGREVERFDNLDVIINHRNYSGTAVTPEKLELRLVTERAFQRAAIKNGHLLAPLASEYWDFRMPGSEAELGRVIESLCRISGQQPPQEATKDYPAFARQFAALDQEKLKKHLGPEIENFTLTPEVFRYCSGKFRPIYDGDLPDDKKIVDKAGFLNARKAADANRSRNL